MGSNKIIRVKYMFFKKKESNEEIAKQLKELRKKRLSTEGKAKLVSLRQREEMKIKAAKAKIKADEQERSFFGKTKKVLTKVRSQSKGFAKKLKW